GLFIGSVVVEAGGKAIIAQRLKLSGMRWTIARADGIIALPQGKQPVEQIWQRPRNQTATA
ncbi:MAG: ISKra4 family transposase, partial [Streptosporangiaceae bacterium]